MQPGSGPLHPEYQACLAFLWRACCFCVSSCCLIAQAMQILILSQHDTRADLKIATGTTANVTAQLGLVTDTRTGNSMQQLWQGSLYAK